MQIQIIQETQISSSLDRDIKQTLCTCFPKNQAIYSRTRAWHDNEPVWTIYIEQDGKVIAHLGFSDQNIQVENECFHVAGVQNVCVLPEYRGRGLSRQLSQAAMHKAQQLEYDFGMLFTREPLVKWYSSADWIFLKERTVLHFDEQGQEVPIPDDQRPMYHTLLHKNFPAGIIRLQTRIW